MNATPHPLTVTVACGESFWLTRPVRAWGLQPWEVGRNVRATYTPLKEPIRGP